MKEAIQFPTDKPAWWNWSIALSVLWLALILALIARPTSLTYIFIVSIIPLGFILLLSRKLDIYVIIILAFINLRVLDAHIGILYDVLLLSFAFIKLTKINRNMIDIPVFKPFLLMICIGMLSLINTSQIKASLKSSVDFFVFTGLVIIISEMIESPKDIYRFFIVFIIASVANALEIIITSFSVNGRIFGTTGLMFVDYVNIAMIVVLIFIFIGPKGIGRKVGWFILFGLLMYSSLIMQTRNAWISLGIIIVSLLIYLYRKAPHYGLNKLMLSRIFGTLAVLSVLFVFIIIQGKLVSTDRLSNFSVDQDTPIEVGAESSLLTRLFIWDTAFNGFRQHPILGIGFYSFRWVSKEYSRLPDFIYEYFVEDVTPHQGYIEILTETGIIGLIAFLFLLYHIFKMAREGLLFRSNYEEQRVSLIAFWCSLYVIFSLGLTDAWLWGSGSSIWGIIVGSAAGVNKLRRKTLDS